MQDSTWKNKLYFGDNLDVLRKHIKDDSVDLCYIDPPFNSKRIYHQIYNNIGGEDRAQAQAFTDTWEWNEMANDGLRQILDNEKGLFMPQSIELIKGLRSVLKEGSLLAYLVSMTLRIAEIHRVLKPTGSFYLHCDSTASHYLKIVLDTIFCSQGGDFGNEIIWKRTSGHSDAQRYGRVHDVVFYYPKGGSPTWNQLYQDYDERYVQQYYRYADEDGRRFMSDNLSASGLSGGGYDYTWKKVRRVWRCPIETMRRLDNEGRIFYTRNGIPRLKRYLDESKGLPMQDVWTDVEPLRSWHEERIGYPTQKPKALLERIIEASSNEGDLVLDAYCGCGTTIEAAHNLKRRWIGIDITYQSISLILKRLENRFKQDMLATVILDGIPKDMESATALARKKDDRLRKEFEKWAVLTYSNNRAAINEKKGADGGVDGTAYFMVSSTDSEKIIFQVKSGNVGRKDIQELRGTMQQEEASIAIFITLQEPTAPMIKAAHAAGTYKHTFMGRSYDRIQIVTVRDMIEKSAKLEMPLTRDAVKTVKPQLKEIQLELRSKKAVQLELQPKPVQLELGNPQ